MQIGLNFRKKPKRNKFWLTCWNMFVTLMCCAWESLPVSKNNTIFISLKASRNIIFLILRIDFYWKIYNKKKAFNPLKLINWRNEYNIFLYNVIRKIIFNSIKHFRCLKQTLMWHQYWVEQRDTSSTVSISDKHYTQT